MRTFGIWTRGIGESARCYRRLEESGRKFGVDVIPYESVWWEDIESIAAHHGLKLRYKPTKSGTFHKPYCPATRIANGLTHYQLYLLCRTTQEPICILEHDSYFVGKPPEEVPSDDAVIQITSHMNKQWDEETAYGCNRAQKMRKYEPDREWVWDNSEGVVRHPLSGLNGTAGYIITPGAADRMINAIYETGIAFADRVRTEYIGEGNLYLQNPQSVLTDHDVKSHTYMR